MRDRTLGGLLYMICAICTGVIGSHIYNSVFYGIICWIFAPFAWIKWLFCHEVSMTIIRQSFEFFFK